MATPTYSEKRLPATLKYFQLRYPNKEYPILAFLYAVMAGGENQLYCDFTEEYAPQYLIGRFLDPEFAHLRTKLLKVLNDLDQRRKEHGSSMPTDAEWDVIGQVVTAELKRGTYPHFVW